jgi:CubicO group peptidase (beta-lactamase class C family)
MMSPESQGMSTARLDALKEGLAAKTKALLVIRNDRLVYEWYAPGHGPTKTHYTASMAKAIVGGLACAIAMSDGKLSLDDNAARFVTQWRDDARKSKITIRQLGSHTSGLEDAEADNLPHAKLTGWKGDFWKRLDPPRDPFAISRDVTPVLFEPGERLAYSNPGIAMLSYVVTAALRESPQKDIRSLLRERVMRPIGATDDEWSVGYGKTFIVDGLPLVGSWGGGGYTARAVARVGRLMLREGDWEGTQLISKEAVRATTADAGTPENGGIGWWSNNEGRYPKLPRDAFWGAGAGHQILLVVPSLKLIAVRNGESLGAGEYHSAVNAQLFEPLVAAVGRDADGQSGAAPYPPSRHIVRLKWAPKESIVRQAKGGDNWPLAWGDDGHLYTAYGDARGFEPFVPEKLSMGLARVEGDPTASRGINLRSASFEHKGEGMRGKKCSGLLMVDGTLYALVRNAGNSQLAWSRDHGQTWTWSDWNFSSSFGCPTFLNFGQNYAGARDDYVYVYSHDHDSAYEPADRMVLARVPKTRIKERAAYEWFAGLQATGEGRWTSHIDKRAAVFVHRGNCYRSGISCSTALRRYLWCQILPTSTHPQGPRFQGGFGIYDAPEPWGPWTTVFYTDAWDVGPGETSSFPTKWMSSDGRTMHLVFSGDDCFSVRKATLTLAASEQSARPLVVEPQLVHLRSGAEREWSSFPAAAAGTKLEARFAAAKNAGELALRLRQQDVKQRWRVLLNGEPLGDLVRDEMDLVAYLPIPAGGMIDGQNLLRIESPPQPSDEVRVGELRVEPRSVRDALAEAALELDVVDADSRSPLPARITIVDANGSLHATGAISTDRLAVRPGVVYTSDGRASVGLPAGKYTIHAGRGFEYSLAQAEVSLAPGDVSRHTLAIRREVPTAGYVACDTHIHTLTHSGHGDASIDERMVTLAGEGLELPIATDHNVHIDYEADARRLGVRRYFTPVVGNEVTTSVGHFNVLPVEQAKTPVPDFKLKEWGAILDSIFFTPLVKIAILNHARDLHGGTRPFGPKLFNAAIGENLAGWPMRFNGMEIINSGATQTDILRLPRDWMALLNRGYEVTPVGSSDSHDVSRYIVGQGRTYIRLDDGDPAKLDVAAAVENFLAGRVLVSYGLLAELTLDGKHRSGDLAGPSGDEVAVDVRVLGPHWTAASRVLLYANGELIREEVIDNQPGRRPPMGVKWQGGWKLPRPRHDTHFVAIALGPGIDEPYWPTAKPYQPASPDWQPHVMGVSGAVWLDGDGDGQRTSARNYAERVAASSGGDLAKLLAALAAYDSATAAQAAHLTGGSALWQSDAGARLLKSAPPHVQAGIRAYLEAARECELAKAQP